MDNTITGRTSSSRRGPQWVELCLQRRNMRRQIVATRKPIRRGQKRSKQVKANQKSANSPRIIINTSAELSYSFAILHALRLNIKQEWWGVLSPFNPSSPLQWSSCKCSMASSATKKGIWILWTFLTVKTNDRTERKDSLAHVF